MKYFVFYDDDYAEDGGTGLERFETAKLAAKFIQERIAAKPAERELLNYTVIFGEEKAVAAVETATRIKIQE